MTTNRVFDRFDAPHQGYALGRCAWLAGRSQIAGIEVSDLTDVTGQCEQLCDLDQSLLE